MITDDDDSLASDFGALFASCEGCSSCFEVTNAVACVGATDVWEVEDVTSADPVSDEYLVWDVLGRVEVSQARLILDMSESQAEYSQALDAQVLHVHVPSGCQADESP